MSKTVKNVMVSDHLLIAAFDDQERRSNQRQKDHRGALPDFSQSA